MGSKTRKIKVRDLVIGGGAPISVQSMCATHTRDIDATLAQIADLEKKGADLIRIAVDNSTDAAALVEIRKSTNARLVVDLQENFPLAENVAPYVDKIRYNPGHLHHLDKTRPIEDKVRWLVNIAKTYGNAIRVGVNCGSVASDFLEKYSAKPHGGTASGGLDDIRAIVESAIWHCDLLDSFHFTNYAVSLKDSDPQKVVLCNKERL